LRPRAKPYKKDLLRRRSSGKRAETEGERASPDPGVFWGNACGTIAKPGERSPPVFRLRKVTSKYEGGGREACSSYLQGSQSEGKKKTTTIGNAKNQVNDLPKKEKGREISFATLRSAKGKVPKTGSEKKRKHWAYAYGGTKKRGGRFRGKPIAKTGSFNSRGGERLFKKKGTCRPLQTLRSGPGRGSSQPIRGEGKRGGGTRA